MNVTTVQAKGTKFFTIVRRGRHMSTVKGKTRGQNTVLNRSETLTAVNYRDSADIVFFARCYRWDRPLGKVMHASVAYRVSWRVAGEK